jgi:hypothetical protein
VLCLVGRLVCGQTGPVVGIGGSESLQTFAVFHNATRLSIAENAEPIRSAVTWNVSMVRSIFVGSVRAGKLRYAVFLILIE